jgi:uncharacterized membrane protein
MIEIIPNWHPIWVHFTIGLLIAGAVFYALAWIGKSHGWAQQALTAARWNLLGGTVFAVMALISGLLAAGSVAHDAAGHANMLLHRNWALATTGIFIVAGIWLWLQNRKAGAQPILLLLVLLMAGAGAVGVTGYKGAANVYEHGLGVQRLPDVAAHDHAAHAHTQDNHEAVESTEDSTHQHGEHPHAEQNAVPVDTNPPASGHDHSTHQHSHDHSPALPQSKQTTEPATAAFTVYKNPHCECCGLWVKHMQNSGFQLAVQETGDMNEIKKNLGVPAEQQSCHTTLWQKGAEQYVFEGHVPAAIIQRFLHEKPKNAKGLLVPGMPVGSPGMENGDQYTPYDVLLLKKDGSTEVYVHVAGGG